MIIRATVALLLLSTVALPPQSVYALTISDTFHFRLNRGANEAGVAAGDLFAVGALNVVPAGPPTTATATQGSSTINLPFVPFSVIPNEYGTNLSFNPALLGSWTITATNGVETTTALTPPIPSPKTIPLVTGLQIVGTGPTPLIQWTLPDVSGLGVDQLRVRVWDLDHDVAGTSATPVKDIIFQSLGLGPSATSFVMPDGVLEFGTHYSFSVALDDFDSATGFGTILSNRSEAFSDPFQPTPEPATLLLFGSTAAGLALARWRQSKRKQ